MIFRNSFSFGGHASTDFFVHLSGENTYNSPGRIYEKITIDGRNGELIIDGGRFSNAAVRYPVLVEGGDFKTAAAGLREMLLSKPGYQRLEDTYHTDEYRMGIYSGNIEFEVGALARFGQTELTFDCMPQRFLKSGETPVSLTIGTKKNFVNPTQMDARPLIKITGTGNGTLTIGNTVITITGVQTSPFFIDCEMRNAFADGSVNMNSHISFIGDFPKLGPGTTGIKLTGFTACQVTPRWWRL